MPKLGHILNNKKEIQVQNISMYAQGSFSNKKLFISHVNNHVNREKQTNLVRVEIKNF